MRYAVAVLMVQESREGDELHFDFEQLLTVVEAAGEAEARQLVLTSAAVGQRVAGGAGVANVVGLAVEEALDE